MEWLAAVELVAEELAGDLGLLLLDDELDVVWQDVELDGPWRISC